MKTLTAIILLGLLYSPFVTQEPGRKAVCKADYARGDTRAHKGGPQKGFSGSY